MNITVVSKYKHMKRGKFILIYLLISSIGLCFTTNLNAAGEYRLTKVVIDAGHGGKDPGALGKKSKEKDIVLAIALKVGKYIDEKIDGVEVIYTRSTDEFIELHKRSEIANKNKADLFISIHANANKNTKASGTDSWVMGIHKNEENLEVAKLENKVILVEEDYSSKYMGFDPNATESYIIFNLMQNIFIEQSLSMASLTQNQLSERAGRKTRGVKSAPFMVLWNCAMPSVLIEVGFVSNPDEEIFITSEYGQDIIASAIYRSFKEYKDKLERRSQLPQQNDISYHVQLLTTKNKINATTFNLTTDIIEISSGDQYKYIAGSTPTYKEINELKEKLKEQYPESFVIAMRKGNLVPLQDAIKETDK